MSIPLLECGIRGGSGQLLTAHAPRRGAAEPRAPLRLIDSDDDNGGSVMSTVRGHGFVVGARLSVDPRRAGYRHVVVVAFLLLLIIVGSILVIMQRRTDPPRVYSVPELETRVARAPRAWKGRIVLVRANVIAIPLGGCHTNIRPGTVGCGAEWVLYDVSGGRGKAVYSIGLTLLPEPPLATFLRQVPGVNRFVPHPQAPLMQRIGTYRIRIGRYDATAMPPLPPINAFLLDAAPGSMPIIPMSTIIVDAA